ncbi:MAG: energy transducer TonB [Bacteroidales bacterium]|nr:energy transducer TonB [Bacteroidales bacterium]MDE7465445.1 energy transducer TonB [Muribaculaceae bacterium]
MAKGSVDLTSAQWRDMIFANKNREFGAYEMRKNSDKRHNLAMIFMLIGLAVIIILIIALSKWSDYRAEQRAIAMAQEREKMSQAILAQQEEEEIPDEPEVEEQKFEQPPVEVPQEVLATVQVTQIAIVDADKVKNEVMDMETQKEDNTARGVVTQEGSDDADKFQAVQEQVVVKEPEPEPVVVKPKEDEIFVAVEQPAEYPGGTAALMKWLANNINYPESAQQNDIQGRVIVKFVVEKDGSIGNVTILKGVDKDLDREAMRVVKKMGKWQPGKNNGVAVRSYFQLPVVFKLAQQ